MYATADVPYQPSALHVLSRQDLAELLRIYAPGLPILPPCCHSTPLVKCYKERVQLLMRRDAPDVDVLEKATDSCMDRRLIGRFRREMVDPCQVRLEWIGRRWRYQEGVCRTIRIVSESMSAQGVHIGRPGTFGARRSLSTANDLIGPVYSASSAEDCNISKNHVE